MYQCTINTSHGVNTNEILCWMKMVKFMNWNIPMYPKPYKMCLWSIILIWNNLAKIKSYWNYPLKGVHQN